MRNSIKKKKKTCWPFPEEKFVLPLSKGKLWDDILEQGNIKDGLDQGPLLIQLLLFYVQIKIHL